MAESANPFGLTPPLVRSVSIPTVDAFQEDGFPPVLIFLDHEVDMDTTVIPALGNFRVYINGVPQALGGPFPDWSSPTRLALASLFGAVPGDVVVVDMLDYDLDYRWKVGKLMDPWTGASGIVHI